MKRLIAISALFIFAVAFAADKATVEAIFKDPAKFDKKVVSVSGKVWHFRAKTSKAGNKYFTFGLDGAKDHLAIYGQGALSPEPKDGDKVEVTGVFAKERTAGTMTFKNEVDVTSKGNDKDKNGVKIVKSS